MKAIKTLALLFMAATLTLGVSAQAATSKTASTQSSAGAKGSTGSTGSTTTAAKPEKNTDKVNPQLHGPKNETVYTGPKGGNYYYSATGTKTYLKSK